jgi:hypothetical protein
MAKTPKKRHPSRLTVLKRRLEKLKHLLCVTPSDKAKASFANQIIDVELQIKVEVVHRLSGFNRINRQELLSGVTPGLGKRA